MPAYEVETWTFESQEAEAGFLAGITAWFEFVGTHLALFPDWLSASCTRELDGQGQATGRYRMTFKYASAASITEYRSQRSAGQSGYEEYDALDVGEIFIDPNRIVVNHWEEIEGADWHT